MFCLSYTLSPSQLVPIPCWEQTGQGTASTSWCFCISPEQTFSTLNLWFVVAYTLQSLYPPWYLGTPQTWSYKGQGGHCSKLDGFLHHQFFGFRYGLLPSGYWGRWLWTDCITILWGRMEKTVVKDFTGKYHHNMRHLAIYLHIS